MKLVYLVVSDDGSPFMVFESYNDALISVENLFGRGAKYVDKHIKSCPYFYDMSKKLDTSDVETVVNIAVDNAIKGYKHATEDLRRIIDDVKRTKEQNR